MAPLLVIISPTDIYIYSGLVLPAKDDESPDNNYRLVAQLNRLSQAIQVRQLVLSLESGEFFRRHAPAFDPQHRVDRALLRNLQLAREHMEKASAKPLDSRIIDAILCRLVFTSYLFDRKIVVPSYLEATGIKETSALSDILSRPIRTAKRDLKKLFKRLAKDFNGDLFQDDLEPHWDDLTQSHFVALDRLFRGADIETGQGSFWPYDFSVIPIETISAIYEHFLKVADPRKKRETGAFYTPRFLAEIILDIALDGMTSLPAKTFFDPACGSGIFLVGLFNRLAEAWKQQNPNASYKKTAGALIQILRTNLFGVDLNPTACHVAAFSLSLALLDQLSPPDIQKLQREGKFLPRLVFDPKVSPETCGHTILCQDFFKAVPPTADMPADFDLVVGNPPWAKMKGAKSSAERWCRNQYLPVANRQLAIAFLWKVTRHQRAGGRACLVLPHGILFNHQRKALKFQKSWLQKHAVDVILNLADMRFNLFEAAVGPALVVRYHKEPPAHAGASIEYLTPKTTWSASQAELIPIPPEDRSVIALDALLTFLRKGYPPRLWKERFWGTPRDWKLLDRLSALPLLGEIVAQTKQRRTKRWTIAEGFKPQLAGDKTENPVRRPWPDTELFLEASAKDAQLFLLPTDCKPIGKRFPWLHRTVSASEIFAEPHVLVWYGLRVAYADFDALFRHGIRGIHGPAEDRDLLIFLTAYLGSPLAAYFLFHTSAYWGIERKQVHLDELLRLPFPFPSPPPNRRHDIVKLVAGAVTRAMKRADRLIANRADIVAETQKTLTAWIYEYFDIDDNEKALIEDTNNITIGSILPSRATDDLPTLRESTPAIRLQYADLLCSTLNEWTRGGPYEIHGSVQPSRESGVAAVILDRRKRGAKPAAAARSPAQFLAVLADLQNSVRRDLGSVELLHGLKYFHGDALYLLKPLRQRFWTRTAALNDADAVAAAILTTPN